jgi:hypothetical protein
MYLSATKIIPQNCEMLLKLLLLDTDSTTFRYRIGIVLVKFSQSFCPGINGTTCNRNILTESSSGDWLACADRGYDYDYDYGIMTNAFKCLTESRATVQS